MGTGFTACGGEAGAIGAMRRLAPAVALCPSNGCLKVCKVVAQ